ncbi:hypothetical protein T492DRAFT_976918 [Pavlovales sp. CCMP2436]|nr:hypothetical protein T492DRAFT_976918 [Pavlovales sp. CCMP2436]
MPRLSPGASEGKGDSRESPATTDAEKGATHGNLATSRTKRALLPPSTYDEEKGASRIKRALPSQPLAEKLPIGVGRLKRSYAASIFLPRGKKSQVIEILLGVYDTAQQAAEVFDAFAHGHNFSCNVHAREQDLLDTNFARPQPIAYLEHRTLLDRRVAIWWKDEQRWFYGKLARYDVPTAEFQNGSFKVDYDDGDDEEGIELGDGVGDAEVAVLPAWWTGLKMKLAA